MHTGRPAIFCRFTGCNLWSGREEDRKSAICNFCDTDFVGTDGEHGGTYTAAALSKKATGLWPDKLAGIPYIVCTGGEPLLQLDDTLIKALHQAGFEVGVETNGTIDPPEGLDWICVSPKPNVEIKLKWGDELKLIYPQSDFPPEKCATWDFKYFFLQPMENQNWTENTKKTIAYCLEHPQWRLSLQTHKYLGLK